MSKVAIVGNASGTGTFTIAAPNSNSDRTLTLPDNAGTILTSASSIAQNSGPTFSACRLDTPDGSQSISANTVTKILYPSELWDTNSCYSSSRFTPTVAGYYQINAQAAVRVSSGTGIRAQIGVYKNGSNWAWGCGPISGITGSEFFCTVSALVYLNGSTDYVEIYCYISGTGPVVDSSSSGSLTYFQGALVRAA